MVAGAANFLLGNPAQRVAPVNMSAVGSHCLQLANYDSFAALHEFREQWDDFVERTGGDLFTSFDWCEVWWKHFGVGRKLDVHIARADQEWVGLFPLFRETLRWGPFVLRVVRLIGCDHCVTTCGTAIRQGWTREVIDELIQSLGARNDWDVLHFGELAGYAASAGEFADAVKNQGDTTKVEFGDNDYPHMVFDVPPNMDAFLAGLSLKERRNVRKDQRELESIGARFVSPRTHDELDRSFDELVKLHGSQWRSRGRAGHFGDWPGSDAFHREFAHRALRANRLSLVEIRTRERLLASEYAVRFGSRMHWIIGGRPTDMSSRIGYLGLLQDAFEHRTTLIDALPGYYDYKRRLGARALGVKNILVAANHARSRRRLATNRSITNLLSFGYDRAWRWHLAPWLVGKMPHLMTRAGGHPLWPRYIRSRFLAQQPRPSDEPRPDQTINHGDPQS